MQRRSLIALAVLAAPAVARAQAFPDRAITLVSGFAPGGSTDITARLLADRMQGFLGPNARIVVENRPGARRAPSRRTGCAASRPMATC